MIWPRRLLVWALTATGSDRERVVKRVRASERGGYAAHSLNIEGVRGHVGQKTMKVYTPIYDLVRGNRGTRTENIDS